MLQTDLSLRHSKHPECDQDCSGALLFIASEINTGVDILSFVGWHGFIV